MRELTMEEVQDVNGGGLLGAILAVLLTPVSVPVAVGVSIAAAVVIGGAIIASLKFIAARDCGRRS